MKKNTDNKKPMTLKPETVRNMTEQNLQTVAGGFTSPTGNTRCYCSLVTSCF